MEHPQLPPGGPGRELASQSQFGHRYPVPLNYIGPRDAELSDGPPESGALFEYWRIIARRKGTLVLVAFLGVIAAVLFTIPQTPVYQARTSLEIQSLNENFLNMRDVNPTMASGGSYSPDSDVQTQMKILQSRSLLERAVKKLNLETRPIPRKDPGRVSAWRNALGLTVIEAIPAAEQVLSTALDNLKVRSHVNTRIVEILYDSTDPKFAADFANAMATSFIEENLEARWRTTQHTSEWLQGQIDEVKIKLERSEDQLQRYAQASGLLFTSDKENIAEQKLRQLQDELSKAQADRVLRQSRYELASSASPDSLPEVLDSTILKEYQIRLTDLRRQVAELSSSLTPAHPKVLKLQAQVVTLESALEKERTDILRRIRNEYDTARRRENLLRADYDAQARLMAEQASKVSHYNILKREVDSTRQLYESMLQRVKEAGVASALRASNIRVIDVAKTPKLPYKPKLPLNATLGGFTGFLGGVIFVILRERADRSIQEPGDTAFYLDVPELGVIPSGSSEPCEKRGALPADGQPHHRRALAASRRARGHPPEQSIELFTRARKFSAVAESFRSALTSILFSTQIHDRPRVLVITSANPGEGKSTVSSNLATALAEINRRVLLIDGDLRKPCLHDVFDMDNGAGLSDFLRLSKGLQLSGAFQQTTVPNLTLLSSGTSSDTTLLHSPRLLELINQVRGEFDTILIDAPPMLQMSDARVFGRLADGVILVIRAQQTSRDAAVLARQRFADDGTRVLGAILNDWNPKHSSAYGYDTYYDSYRRYYGTHKHTDSAPASAAGTDAEGGDERRAGA